MLFSFVHTLKHSQIHHLQFTFSRKRGFLCVANMKSNHSYANNVKHKYYANSKKIEKTVMLHFDENTKMFFFRDWISAQLTYYQLLF